MLIFQFSLQVTFSHSICNIGFRRILYGGVKMGTFGDWRFLLVSPFLKGLRVVSTFHRFFIIQILKMPFFQEPRVCG